MEIVYQVYNVYLYNKQKIMINKAAQCSNKLKRLIQEAGRPPVLRAFRLPFGFLLLH